MIELKTTYSLSQIPYISYEALEEYAESIIKIYSPKLLSTPGELDILDLLQDYLGLSVIYQTLSYDEKTMGITAFHDDYIQVLEKQTGCIMSIPVKAKTIVIDTSLKSKMNLRRMRFTLGHEGSHYLLHQKTFSKENINNMGMSGNQYLAAKTGHIDYNRGIGKNEKERMERQADFLAAALLMPRSAMRIAYKDFFSGIGETPRVLTRGKGQERDVLVKQLTSYIADTFNVSNRAATIRLEKLNAV